MKKTFKTKKGTEIPLLNLKGNDYLQVPWRVFWMREEHPDWRIRTLIDVDPDRNGCIATADIINENGETIATAHKYEDRKGFADFIEKSETGAIGRALALCGYGTQFAPDLLEDDRLADSPLETKSSPPKHFNSTPIPQEEYTFLAEEDENPAPKPMVGGDSSFAPIDKALMVGKHTGKKFSELISHHMDYVTWAKGNGTSPILKDLVKYAEFHGVFKV
jgi:hypothetical protein